MLREIDFKRAQDAKNRAESLLESGVKEDVDQYRSILAALRRSQLRLYACEEVSAWICGANKDKVARKGMSDAGFYP